MYVDAMQGAAAAAGHAQAHIAKRAQSVMKLNPPYPAQIHLSTQGSDWLWTVTAIYIVVDLAFMIWTLFLKRGTKVYHHLAIMILTIGVVAYFLQASDLGFTTTPTEFSHYKPKGTLRQVWYARYVDYILTFPMLVMLFFFLTGLNVSDIVIGCFMISATFACFLIGMLIRSTYKWPFYTFGVCFLFYEWAILLGPGRRSAQRMGRDFHIMYLVSVCWFILLTLIYPIAWGCCEGGNTVSTNSEFVWYGILDLFLKPFFLIFFLIFIGRLDLSKLQFYSGKYTDQNHGYPPHVHPTDERAALAAAGVPIPGGPVGANTTAAGYPATGYPAYATTGAGTGPDPNAPVTTEKSPRGAHGLTIVDNPPRKAGKFFSRRGAHDDTTTAAATPKPPKEKKSRWKKGRTSEDTAGTTDTEDAGAVTATEDVPPVVPAVDTNEPHHTHTTKTRTVVHGHSADGEPRLSEATVVSEERYP